MTHHWRNTLLFPCSELFDCEMLQERHASAKQTYLRATAEVRVFFETCRYARDFKIPQQVHGRMFVLVLLHAIYQEACKVVQICKAISMAKY